MRSWLACLAVVCLVIPSAAFATVYDVSSIAQFKSALAMVNPGDEVRIAYGVYHVQTADDAKHWFRRPSGNVNGQPIRITGVPGPNGEMPVFDATGQAIERGVFYIWNDVSNYVFENLEIRNARGQDVLSNNAAAAYIGGTNITFRNCYSHHNDNGWFSTTSASNTLLENCETAYNGKVGGGDMTHNHYMASQSLTVRGCYIHDSTEGQNFKSRATGVVFEYNWLEKAASYEWELASNNKGNSLLIGNVIIKRPGSGNRRIVQLSDGTVTDATSGTLTLINNTIISSGANDPYVTSINVATANVVLYNNVFAGASARLLDWQGTGTATGSNNWMPNGTTVPAGVIASLFGTDPGFVNAAGKDYHLLAWSPLRNSALNTPQWLNWLSAWEVRVPDKEYLAAARTKGRLADATLDIGAFEGPLWPGDINNDGGVDVVDLLYFVDSFGLATGDPGYNPLCDLNGDDSVDVVDLLTLVEDFGKP
jgi:hypothetical protein